MPDLPVSARFALWFTAWLDGQVSLDDARDGIVGSDTAHHVLDLPGAPGAQPLIVALGLLRARHATGAGLALPVAGDPLGLAGPTAFNAEVLDAGEGVVLEDADLGLVPVPVASAVQWVAQPAVSRRQLPDPSEADSSLRRTLAETAAVLADLEVSRWRPEVADELMALRRPADLPVPASMPARALALASTGARCRRIVDLALRDDGGSISLTEATARREALGPLERAGRRALVAACSPRVWPPPS